MLKRTPLQHSLQATVHTDNPKVYSGSGPTVATPQQCYERGIASGTVHDRCYIVLRYCSDYHISTLAASRMQCTDLNMGSPQARKSIRRPKVPVKAIPMSLKEEERWRGREEVREREREEGREIEGGRGRSKGRRGDYFHGMSEGKWFTVHIMQVK